MREKKRKRWIRLVPTRAMSSNTASRVPRVCMKIAVGWPRAGGIQTNERDGCRLNLHAQFGAFCKDPLFGVQSAVQFRSPCFREALTSFLVFVFYHRSRPFSFLWKGCFGLYAWYLSVFVGVGICLSERITKLTKSWRTIDHASSYLFGRDDSECTWPLCLFRRITKLTE